MDLEVEDLTSLLAIDGEPEVSSFKTTTAALDASTALDFSNTSDLDLANLLYIHRIPSVPDSQKSDLESLVQNINLWEAWELTKTEEAVQGKVSSGQLPSDNSVDAKTKRTGYRKKVIDFLRNRSPWLGVTSANTQTSEASDTEKAINLDILHALLGTSPLPKDVQFTTLLKAIGPGFDVTNNMIQPYFLTVVDFTLDAITEKFKAKLTTLAFEVHITEAESSARAAAAGKAKTTKEKNYKAVIGYSVTAATFNVPQWDNAKPANAAVELGKKLLQQKQLNLLQG